MPTYSYRCPKGHVFDRFCSIRERDENPTPLCPVIVPEDPEYAGLGEEGCGEPSTQVFTAMPAINNTEVMILDYPGSKRLKAGYVHAYVDPGVRKVSVGYGGALNPRTAPMDPVADMVRPAKRRPER